MSREEITSVRFEDLGIAETLLERLRALKFEHPTPIQHQAIPIAVKGEDLVGIAQTGTGKTLAFSLPLLQRIAREKKIGLVLLPTRELAVQVAETFQKVAGPLGLRIATVIGGASMHHQMKQLKNRPHVIVSTPGRLIDHLEQKNVKLDQVGVLVLDEADRMLDMGFEPQLKRILATVPKERQTLLFSATMPPEISAIARNYMTSPVRVEVAPAGTTAERVEQEVFIVPKPEKTALLAKLLKEYTGTVLVFTRTKHGAKKLARDIRNMRVTADELHGNRSQNQRQKALKDFTTGRCRVLVATDIAARGIDVKNIELVVNYDLPEQPEDYVHRIGRTGRAGTAGKAISFAAPEQKRDVLTIERLIKATIPMKLPSGEAAQRPTGQAPSGSSRSRGRSRGPRQPGGRQSYRGRSRARRRR